MLAKTSTLQIVCIAGAASIYHPSAAKIPLWRQSDESSVGCARGEHVLLVYHISLKAAAPAVSSKGGSANFSSFSPLSHVFQNRGRACGLLACWQCELALNGNFHAISSRDDKNWHDYVIYVKRKYRWTVVLQWELLVTMEAKYREKNDVTMTLQS